jgi:hypothetical protein
VGNEYAKDHDLDVIFPRQNELFLDIDSEADYKTFVKNKPLLSDQKSNKTIEEIACTERQLNWRTNLEQPPMLRPRVG